MPYLPYLPRDSPDDPDYDHCTSILVHDLRVASRLKVGELCRTAQEDPSLVELLRSYVILAPRFYEPDHDSRACALVLEILSKLFASPTPAMSRASMLRPLLEVDAVLETAALIGYLPKGISVVGSMIRAARDPPLLLPVAVRHLSWSMSRAAEQVAARLQRSLNSIEEAVIPLSGIRSTLLTLRAFLPACPAASLRQLCRDEDLLACLSLVHDQLCPALGSVLRVFDDSDGDGGPSSSGPVLSQARTLAAQIEIASGSLAVLLLRQGILNGDDEEDANGGPSSSSSSIMSSSAMAAGAALVEAVQSLVSSAPSLSAASSRTHPGLSAPTLANAMVDVHGLGETVSRAQDSGRIHLDDAQIDYLAALLPGIWSTEGTRVSDSASVSASQKTARSTSAWQPGSLQAASVQTVRELLPDLAPGFVAASLDAVGGQPEAAISAILDGSIPPAVSALGRDAGWDAYAAFIGASTNLGNGTLEATSESETDQHETKPNKNPRPAPGTVKAGPSKRFLDVREGGLRRQLQARAREAQWEYEDEYDDSLEHDLALGARDINEEDEMPDITSRLHLGGGEPPPSRAPKTAAAPLRNKDGKGAGFRQWVLDGRVYNYKKEGAVQATSADHARQLVADAAARKEEIYGLGRGGNVPLQAEPASEPDNQRISEAPRASQGTQPRDHRRKEQHKSGVANHHRKDRAARKLQHAL